MRRYILTIIYKNGEIFDFDFSTKCERSLYFESVKLSNEIKQFTFWETEKTFER